jgi:predicted deacylase
MRTFLLAMILACLIGCQYNPQQVSLPTLVTLPAVSPTPFPTRVVRAIPTRATTATFTPLPTRPATLTPFPSPTFVQIPTLPASFTFGQSVFGRSLIAYRFGEGEKVLMLVGGVHGGWESNTVELMNQLIAYFETTPSALVSGVSLIIIPQLNPDGVARGRTLEGRFNDHRVDLNRNWGCGWESVAYFQNQEVSPGISAFSEPETQALSTLILETRPSVVLFYHSAADGVFAGSCDNQDAGSNAMSAVLGEATGYNYGREFTSYKVTGTAPSWVVSAGIASADVELATWRTSEFDRNLRGIMAVQCWILQKAAPCS